MQQYLDLVDLVLKEGIRVLLIIIIVLLIFLKPGIDIINIPQKDGSNYVEIEEADNTTNILTGVPRGTGQEVYPNLYNNGVIHEINKVLKVEELDIR